MRVIYRRAERETLAASKFASGILIHKQGDFERVPDLVFHVARSPSSLEDALTYIPRPELRRAYLQERYFSMVKSELISSRADVLALLRVIFVRC